MQFSIFNIWMIRAEKEATDVPVTYMKYWTTSRDQVSRTQIRECDTINYQSLYMSNNFTVYMKAYGGR